MHQAKSVVWIISGPCHNMCSGKKWLHRYHHRGLNGPYFSSNTQTRVCVSLTGYNLEKPSTVLRLHTGRLLLSAMASSGLPTPTAPWRSENSLLFVKSQICQDMSHPNTQLMHICLSSQTLNNHTWSDQLLFTFDTMMIWETSMENAKPSLACWWESWAVSRRNYIARNTVLYVLLSVSIMQRAESLKLPIKT